ncbi:DUF2750 domain-containing protein [Chitinimonas sp.]|uniref:DUF2750 domain-containing protein n=1 Tax=Chitinimonas sp. TaxID=1934313 RepID=UPI0035ADED9A
MKNSYFLSPQEFAALSSLNGDARFEHFVKRVADRQTVWGLRNPEGWVSASDDAGNEGFPVWPHPNYATACASSEWTAHSPVAIEIELFVSEWLPKMEEQNLNVIVFPTTELRGVRISASELRKILVQELSQYE